MSKITYENKVGIEPKTIAINQVQDVDMNQIKSVVNDNDLCSVSIAYPILNDKTSAGRRYGTWYVPMNGVIVLSNTGIQEGGCAVVIWQGATNPVMTGGIIQSLAGEITAQGTYSIYFHYLNGRYNVNIFNVDGTTPPVALPDAPTNLASGTPTETTIPLTWTKSISGVMTEYRAYDDDVLMQTFIGDVASGTLTGLSPSTTYTNISVRAYDGALESVNSNLINATTQGGVTPSATAPTIEVTDPIPPIGDVIFDTDGADSLTDFAGLNANTVVTHLNGKMQVSQIAGLSGAIITLNNGVFGSGYGNWKVPNTYQFDVTVVTSDPLYLNEVFKIPYPLAGVTMVAGVTIIGTFYATFQGSSAGSSQWQFQGDGVTTFSGEEIEISRCVVYDLGVI